MDKITEVSQKLATIMYRDVYKKAVAPLARELDNEKAERIDKYITKLYMEAKLLPYSCAGLIYTNDIPEGMDGNISREDIENRMMEVVNDDIGAVLPVNGRVLPFHPYIKGWSINRPLFVPGMYELKEIFNSMEPGGYIIVTGDYDVDGVASQSICINCLVAMNYEVKVIPNERANGNGHNKTTHGKVMAMMKAIPGCRAVILTDHGSGLVDIERLEELNSIVPVAVIDHHKVTGPTSDVVTAFVNSRESEYQELSAGALAWQCMLYIGAPVEVLEDMLPFAAMSLITDMMDMSIWYTNLMYREGIKLGRTKPNQVLEIFLKSLRGKNSLSETIIGFNIGPVLNAGHRMNNAAKSVALLCAPATIDKYQKELTEDGSSVIDHIHKIVLAVDREINGNYKDLINLNNMRKLKSARGVTAGIKAYHEYKKQYKYGAVLVLDKIEDTVIGIVSSSIGSLFGEPTITFSRISNYYKGSGRSIIKGLDCEAICSNIKKEHPDVVLDGGGHPEAFGYRVALGKMEDFKRLFAEALAEHAHIDGGLVAEEIPTTPYPLDATDKQILDDLINYEPYGKVEKPHYTIMGKIELDSFGKKLEHLKITIGKHTAIYFNGAKEFDNDATYTGMVVTVSPDTFRGGLQLIVYKLIRKE